MDFAKLSVVKVVLNRCSRLATVACDSPARSFELGDVSQLEHTAFLFGPFVLGKRILSTVQEESKRVVRTGLGTPRWIEVEWSFSTRGTVHVPLEGYAQTRIEGLKQFLRFLSFRTRLYQSIAVIKNPTHLHLGPLSCR